MMMWEKKSKTKDFRSLSEILIKQCYNFAWSVEKKKQKVKTRGLQRQIKKS